MIRMGVDAWNLPGDRRGIGRYVRALLDAWAEHFRDRIEPVLIVPEWHTWTAGPRYRRELHNRPYEIRSRARYARAGLDALWFPFNGPSWTNFTLPSIATLHDAMPFVRAEYPDTEKLTYLNAARRCEALITDSNAARRELARFLSIAPERIEPIALGVAPAKTWVRSAVDTTSFGQYVLFVGETDPRKGIDTLIAAMQQLRRTDVRLVIAGRISQQIPYADDVEIDALGFVDDDTLAQLYRDCAVFAMPSRYEGFGLPVLEAMSNSAPVVASTADALVEAGGDAALYAPIDDAPALAAAIARILDDPALASQLRTRGRERAAGMTWRKTADATLTVFERVVAESGHR